MTAPRQKRIERDNARREAAEALLAQLRELTGIDSGRVSFTGQITMPPYMLKRASQRLRALASRQKSSAPA